MLIIFKDATLSNEVIDTKDKRVDLYNQRVMNYAVNLLWIFMSLLMVSRYFCIGIFRWYNVCCIPHLKWINNNSNNNGQNNINNSNNENNHNNTEDNESQNW